MPGGGHAVETRMHETKEPAQQALAGKQLANEIAHMACVDVFGFQIDRGQTLADHLGEGVRKVHLFARPVGGKVALPSAQNIDHYASPLTATDADHLD